jgi:hypothetical protein
MKSIKNISEKIEGRQINANQYQRRFLGPDKLKRKLPHLCK